jgi:excisionase family DNA binding protein
MEKLLDSKQAAELLGISVKSLQLYARAEDLPAVRIGRLWRFRKEDLDQWVKSRIPFFRHLCRAEPAK